MWGYRDEFCGYREERFSRDIRNNFVGVALSMYVVVPGRDLERIASEISTIAQANAQLAQYHEQRRQSLTA